VVEHAQEWQEHRRGGQRARPQAEREIFGIEVVCSRKARRSSDAPLEPRTPSAASLPVTTDSNHRFSVSANVLTGAFRVETPNLVWATDIMYIWTQEPRGLALSGVDPGPVLAPSRKLRHERADQRRRNGDLPSNDAALSRVLWDACCSLGLLRRISRQLLPSMVNTIVFV